MLFFHYLSTSPRGGALHNTHTMKPAASTLTSKIDARSGLWMGIATLVVAAYLTVGAVFGLDVCDSGFYMTFYARIFDAPGTVEYNFMYYLSGLVGGTLLHFFPGMGLLGMRLAVMHNLWFYNHLMERIRDELDAGTFTAFHDRYVKLLDTRI